MFSLLATLAFLATKVVLPAPLAAAMVINNQLVLVDVPTRTLKPYDLPDLRPEEADLSPDKRDIVFNARPTTGGPSRIYLADVDTGRIHRLEIALDGDQRFPKFADSGRSIIFTAPPEAGADSPRNHNRVREFDLASGSLSELATPAKLCNYVPVAWGRSKYAYLSTTCFTDFQVKSGEAKSNTSRKVANVAGPHSELTSSLNGKKLLYTDVSGDGLSFFLVVGSAAPKHLATVPRSGARAQPRFVCPRDVLFVNMNKIWALNSDTGTVTELMDVIIPLRGTAVTTLLDGGSQ